MYKVYGTRICLYCDKAENLLKTKDLPFEKIYIDEDDDAMTIMKIIAILILADVGDDDRDDEAVMKTLGLWNAKTETLGGLKLGL